MKRRLMFVALLAASLPVASSAQDGKGKGVRLWNLTTATITAFHLSPAGANSFGPNLTLNDKDKEVDHDERLRLPGIGPGVYDAKVGYGGGKQCLVRNLEIKADAVFSIADKDLKDCSR